MTTNEIQLQLLAKASRAIHPAQFDEYFELRRLLGTRTPTARREFQTRFTTYYRLNNAGLTERFKRQYFKHLFSFEPQGQEDPHSPILIALYKIPRRQGDHSLQASFVSKLVAIHDESWPLYDAHVSKFFGMSPPALGSCR